MLLPKKVKYRKWHTFRKNANKVGVASRGAKIDFGSHALKAMDGARIMSNQIEAARKVTHQPIATQETERRAGDPPVLVADAKRAQEILNWKPAYSDLSTIINTAWQWRRRQNGMQDIAVPAVVAPPEKLAG